MKDHLKPDGTEYDLYRDGLKIYTTIDSKMQQYAEEAVQEHLKNLQKEFFKGMKDKENAPFVDITPEQTNQIMMQAMKNSERWRKMDLNGKTADEIIKSF